MSAPRCDGGCGLWDCGRPAGHAGPCQPPDVDSEPKTLPAPKPPPAPAPLTHFVVHGERAKNYRKMNLPGYSRKVKPVRTVCGDVAAALDAKALRQEAEVTCPQCMVIKDTWLSQPKRKPLTIRRARQLRRSP